MIYVIGDSFSFGYNFLEENNPERKNIIYPTLLAKKFDMECKNLSCPGGSNWRTARVVQTLEFTENDIVIVTWGSSLRFEIGISKQQLFPNDILVDIHDIENFENLKHAKTSPDNFSILNFVETYDNVLTRRFWGNMLTYLYKIKNHNFRNLAENLFTNYAGTEWLEQMFLIMYSSTLHKLTNSKCKFIMFNTSDLPYGKYNSIFDIPQYFLSGKSHMCSYIRNDNNRYYWDQKEHLQVADIIYNYVRKIYDIQ